jgi:hypothetical protein
MLITLLFIQGEIFQVRSPTVRVCCRFSGITATAYSLRVLALPRREREVT